MRWYTELTIRAANLVLRTHAADELPHYASATSDIEYRFPMGFSELEGIANRGNFDLTQHAEFPGEKLEYCDQGSGERYVPHVIEPAAGIERATLAFIVDAYWSSRSRAEPGPFYRCTRSSPRSRSQCCRSSTKRGCPSAPAPSSTP